MSEHDSKTLTIIPENFSDGVFLNSCTDPLTHSHLLLSNQPELVALRWQTHNLPAGFSVRYQLSIGRTVTGSEERVPSCLLERLQCHYLKDSIPDAGMPRLFECLRDIVDDYVDRPYSGPVISKRGPVPIATGKTYERPALEYSED